MDKIIISIVGSGRVAEALAVALCQAGHDIGGILSRNLNTASDLAIRVNAPVLEANRVPRETGLVIMAVSDDSIYSLSRQLKINPSTVVVHTSGSKGLNVFPGSLPRTGVIYPLQTFTRGRQTELGTVHFFTEASDAGTLIIIDNVVSSVSGNIHHLDSESRSKLHLAAVFVSNFSNHMLFAGMELARKEGVDLSVFAPLIRETVEKALEMGPVAAQTGPALRNDISTMEKHLEMLSFSEDLRNLYKNISDSIIRHKA